MLWKINDAAKQGDVAKLNSLWEAASLDQRNEALEAFDYLVFWSGAINGHLPVVNRLWELASPKQRNEMLKAVNYFALTFAAAQGEEIVVKTLLAFCSGEVLVAALKAVADYPFVPVKISSEIATYNNPESEFRKQVEEIRELQKHISEVSKALDQHLPFVPIHIVTSYMEDYTVSNPSWKAYVIYPECCVWSSYSSVQPADSNISVSNHGAMLQIFS